MREWLHFRAVRLLTNRRAAKLSLATSNHKLPEARQKMEKCRKTAQCPAVGLFPVPVLGFAVLPPAPAKKWPINGN
jgi:hypothetical protein